MLRRCLLLWGSLIPALLGASGSLGTEFWLAFPANYTYLPTTLSVFISAGSATTGSVDVPGLGVSIPFSVAGGAIINVPITNTAQLSIGTSSDLEAVENKGVHITASGPVTVYGLNRQQYTTDAFLGLPLDALGTSYRVASYDGAGSELGVVATVDNTTVTFTLTAATAGHAAGVPYSVVLNKGQTYSLFNSQMTISDLSGSLVSADQPVAVFGAHRCANIPNLSYGACDHLVEQMTPLSAWGKRFVTFPLATRLNGDIFRVMASQPATTVSLNGVPLPVLQPGQFHQLTLTAASLIESDQPVMVAQYSAGTSWDGVVSDPFMMLVPPYEQFVNQYVVSTPASGFSQNFINLMVPASEVGAAKLDGVAVPASAYSPIGSSGYYGAALPVALGPHSISGASPVGVLVYGFDQADSYGYPGGAQTSAVALVDQLILTPKTASRLLGEQHCVTATALAGVSPVAGVRVDFVRSGAHPGSGFAFTDAAGRAVWCWTGSVSGHDAVRASLGTLSDTAGVDWTVFTPTVTPSFTVTPSATASPTRTQSATFTVSPTFTASPTITPTFTPTPPPLTLALFPPNPNPARDAIWLPYRLGTDADVEVKVWTVAGEPVCTWPEGFRRQGNNEAYWDLKNQGGARVASGIFIYRVSGRSPAGEYRDAYGKCAVAR